MTFKPVGKRVLVKMIENETTTKGGIVLPDATSKESNRGQVISVGSEITDIQEKNIIVFTKHYGIKIDEEDYSVVNVEDILGIL